MKKNNLIRVKVLAWIEDNSQLFVARIHDSVKGDDYYRPIGGSVEFGETTTDALLREVKEELDADICINGEPLILENIFTCGGEEGHEIDFLYPACFIETKYQERRTYPLLEENGAPFESMWIDLSACLDGNLRLVPEGLVKWYRARG